MSEEEAWIADGVPLELFTALEKRMHYILAGKHQLLGDFFKKHNDATALSENTCVSCEQLLEKPMALNNCAHSVCEACLPGLTRCPKCNKQVREASCRFDSARRAAVYRLKLQVGRVARRRVVCMFLGVSGCFFFVLVFFFSFFFSCGRAARLDGACQRRQPEHGHRPLTRNDQRTQRRRDGCCAHTRAHAGGGGATHMFAARVRL